MNKEDRWDRCLSFLKKRNNLESIFSSCLQKLVEQHPGEYCLIKDEKISVFKTKSELQEITKKYNEETFLTRRIPFHLEGGGFIFPDLFVTKNYIETCIYHPNTKLPERAVESRMENGQYIYKENTYCPECGLVIWRKPSQARISEVMENMQRPLGALLETSLVL